MLRCGLLGETLGHSYSPLLHKHLGDYSYTLFPTPPEQLAAFLQTGDFHGLNVTIPYKTAVIPYCAALSPAAAAIGSVNTILRRPDGTLYGDNTDAAGFAAMLQKSGIAVQGKKVLVLGSGGASRSVRYVLQAQGAGEIVVISRNGADNYDNLDRHRDAAVLVNTTPVGMYPHNGSVPLDVSDFPHCAGVLDLIYNPARTQLVMQAAALGIPALGGLSMLAYQAAAAAERFLGTDALSVAPAAERALLALERATENIILIGMPGCGKTTIARLLAARLGRDWIDADEALEQAAQKNIPAIFGEEGEAGFRRRETEILADLGKRAGLVIATGGGCVTRAENYPLLHQNGRIVFIEREVAHLERAGRPLSVGADLVAMYETRLPLYRRFCDLSIKNETPPEETAARLWEMLYEHTGPQRPESEPARQA